MHITDALTQLNLDNHLRDLETLLKDSVSVNNSFLSDVTRHLIDAGGKRIRPVLAITSAAAGGATITQEILEAGMAVELVHLASLYHDDVMDNALQRRNVESVNSRWGNLVAIVAGDYLLAKAAGIAARLGQEIAELLANTLAELCAGQILEVQTAFDTSRTPESYLRAISGKTASLMATACRIGALAANLERNHVEAVTKIGHSLGMVFQIRDDILDLTASSELLGKDPAQDLLEGIYTLPVIEALKSQYGGALEPVLTRDMDISAIDKALTLIKSSNGVGKAWRRAREFAEESAKSAAKLDSPVASELGFLATFLLEETLPVVAPFLDE